MFFRDYIISLKHSDIILHFSFLSINKRYLDKNSLLLGSWFDVFEACQAQNEFSFYANQTITGCLHSTLRLLYN